ncbi:anchored repeat-type ABC transporter permease subunit [Corynebacterium sp. 13CS0277]|uniref:anchored repeat-type ABC transporter permease subunit n=1 Tax=Corynebacterium sp. 13CS0277 TaxID=2071994 RepID=UPI000D0229D7|nr:anchored repeat-type ABC transporter permease subunit [Corynebacterium sp. 13CS0277]PRQ11899.1 anchored repeat-type ABC transporter permease subunit [Corynebacterium sp. 13CS0277]
MITPWEFLADMANPQLDFLPRALLVAVLSAALCGLTGSLVVVRGMAFIGDAVAHAVFPGLAIAFVLGGSLLLGGLAAAVVCVVLIATVSHRGRVSEDSAIGVFFAASFAIGLVVLSRSPAYSASVTGFLFGSLTGASAADAAVVAGTLVVMIVLMAVAGRLIVATSVDPMTARAMGVPVRAVDLGIYIAIALTVVVSVRTVGNVLVLALLVTPAATARLLCYRLVPMMVTAGVLGALSAVVGVYLAWAWDTPAGATIVLVTTGCFLAAWAIPPVVRRLPAVRISAPQN